MKTFGFFLFIFLGSLASAQEKKKDSVKADSVIYEYKERWYYPFGSGLSPKSFEKKPAKNNTKKRKVKQPPKKQELEKETSTYYIYSEQA